MERSSNLVPHGMVLGQQDRFRSYSDLGPWTPPHYHREPLEVHRLCAACHWLPEMRMPFGCSPSRPAHGPTLLLVIYKNGGAQYVDDGGLF